MINNWHKVSLGELFRVKHGFPFKSEYFTDEPQDAVLVTPGNFAIGGGFQDGKRKYYNGQLPEDYVLKPGQVVVTMTDLSKESDTLGYAASIPNDSNIWLHNQRVGLLEFKLEIPTSPRFIEYLLRTHEYRSWIVGSATGTTVKHTAPGRIENFATRIPPIEEQRAIAHILGTLDDKIELNRKQNETLEAMARALFKAWFVDFEPVRAKLEGRWQRGESLPGLPAHLYDLFPDRLVESELGEIPYGWVYDKIGSVSKVKGGFAYKSEEFTNAGWPVVKIKNITGDGTVNLQDVQYIDSAIAEKTRRFALKDGDIVIAMTGATVGKTGIIVSDSLTPYLNQRVAKFEENSEGQDNKWFVFIAFQYPPIFNQVVNTASGSAQPNISTTGIESVRLIVTNNIKLLDAFNKIVSPIFEHWIDINKQSRTLAQLRDTLLPKLISGELRIPDAEAFLKERGL